jgi:hypothetical protein
MVINKYQELDKITFIGRVDKTIDQLLTKDNIRLRFRVINIWHVNLIAMDEKTQLLMIYIKK